MRILIAEDDIISRSFLSRFLGKYGDCDLVVDGLETVDAFLMALKENRPYDLITLDIMMPRADGVKALRAIRDLEREYGIEDADRVKVIMTTALAEAQLVQTVFEYGCEAYATKPIDTKKMTEVLDRLGIAPKGYGYTSARNVTKSDLELRNDENIEGNNHLKIKAVKALTGYTLEVEADSGTKFQLDFRSRLNTIKFGRLMDLELFQSVVTDGSNLIFGNGSKQELVISAAEFMDLVKMDQNK